MPAAQPDNVCIWLGNVEGGKPMKTNRNQEHWSTGCRLAQIRNFYLNKVTSDRQHPTVCEANLWRSGAFMCVCVCKCACTHTWQKSDNRKILEMSTDSIPWVVSVPSGRPTARPRIIYRPGASDFKGSWRVSSQAVWSLAGVIFWYGYLVNGHACVHKQRNG